MKFAERCGSSWKTYFLCGVQWRNGRGYVFGGRRWVSGGSHYRGGGGRVATLERRILCCFGALAALFSTTHSAPHATLPPPTGRGWRPEPCTGRCGPYSRRWRSSSGAEPGRASGGHHAPGALRRGCGRACWASLLQEPPGRRGCLKNLGYGCYNFSHEMLLFRQIFWGETWRDTMKFY